MVSTAQDVYDRVRRELGILARRHRLDLVVPTPDDTTVLEDHLEDAVAEVATRSERYRDHLTRTTTADQGWVKRPVFVHHLHGAAVQPGGGALTIGDGRTVAHKARAESAATGCPTEIGALGERLYLYPVPDKEYTLDLTISLNGAIGTGTTTDAAWYFFRPVQLFTVGSATGSGGLPPTLDGYIERTPHPLALAFVHYVAAEWLMDSTEYEAAGIEEEKFEQVLDRQRNEPIEPNTATRPYYPHSF